MDRRPAPKSRRSALNAAIGTISGGWHPSSQDNRRSPTNDSHATHAQPEALSAAASVQNPLDNSIDASWMLPDYNILPSQDNYYRNLMNQDDTDNLGLEDCVQVDPLVANMNSQTKPKGRSKNFTDDEDILLLSVYLNVSKDPTAGRDQKDSRFWERIEKYYHVNLTFESDRNCSSLRHRWGIIQKEVSLFQSYYEAIQRKNESGKTMNDKISDAKAMFQTLRKKAFTLFHAWNILRHEPKWSSIKDSTMATKKLDPHNGNEDDGHDTPRPPGRKAEKEKLRARKQEDNDNDALMEELKKLESQDWR
ncbi:uncharacterized protein [Zea mays]|uniref:uncharacterized protein isoform X1 n=1 Tax=Zea mays TaxID=4577 RepID=UPI0009AAB3A9|nr:uncharacterized protein LOC103636663 isoform X1 [Zea mays]|eukprot:XP_008657235.2 uncharacterized protein LOC103636663 isoform X1 [Zea mays]